MNSMQFSGLKLDMVRPPGFTLGGGHRFGTGLVFVRSVLVIFSIFFMKTGVFFEVFKLLFCFN